MRISINTTICFLFLEALILSADVMVSQCIGKINSRLMILTPPDQAIIVSEKIHFVVEVINLDLANVKLEVTPSRLLLEELHLRKNNFHFSVRLDNGPNKIKLRLIDSRINEVVGEMDMNLLYETDGIETAMINIGTLPIIWYKTLQETPPSEPHKLRRYQFHTIDREVGCKKCHALSNSDPQKRHLGKLSCYSCHRDLFQEWNLHSPKMQSPDCRECHKENQGPGYRFNRLSAEVCLSCHGDTMLTRQYLHGPVEYGECWICHDPHNGRTRYRLKKKVNQLCIRCHGGKHSGKIGVNNHPILPSVNNPLFGGREYKCTGCHAPHGSDTNKFLLLCDTHDPDEPCERCHPQYSLYKT